MSMVLRQMLWGIATAMAVFVLLLISFMFVFPVAGWQDLWEKELMDIPFILFVTSVSLVAGICSGFFSGIYLRKQFLSIEELLYTVEEGRAPERKDLNSAEELQSIYRRVQRIQKQLSEQALLAQRLANEMAETREEYVRKIIFEERNRLARELHDSVSQQLFAASMLMSAINETRAPDDESRESKQLKMVENMIQQSQLEMRALLLHLRPVALKGKSLQEGIEELLTELAQKVPMKIKWKIEDFPLDKGVEDHLFRILQESVSNTLRHSRAAELEVLLIKRGGFVILRVADDGIGFDVEESKAGSYGIQNMHERAVEIGGTLKIVSVKNKGTRLEVKVPVQLEGENDD